jgi:hypothetical protein
VLYIGFLSRLVNYVKYLAKEERNIQHKMKGKWIGHILPRNCRLKHVIEGKKGGMVRRGRTRKQLLDDLKEKRRYWNLREEVQDRTL